MLELIEDLGGREQWEIRKPGPVARNKQGDMISFFSDPNYLRGFNMRVVLKAAGPLPKNRADFEQEAAMRNASFADDQ
jgi:hypothetical protein